MVRYMYMKKIQLGGHRGSPIRGYALVDDSDFDWLNQWRWSFDRRKGFAHAYACRTEYINRKPTNIRMHVILMNRSLKRSDKLCVDHINGNGLDNRRSNLRVVSYGVNIVSAFNRKRKPNGYLGVRPNRHVNAKNKWVAFIGTGKKYKHLGQFTTKKQAALAYNNAALQEYGDYAVLNHV